MGPDPSNTLLCPRCGDAAALEGSPDSADGAACPRCAGAFLGEAASRSLFEDTLHLGKDTLSAVAESVGGRSVPCPGCRNAMRYLRIRSASIDFCFTCGSCWLDKGELAFLVASSFPQASNAPPPRAPVSPLAPGPPRPVARTLAMRLGTWLYPEDPNPFTWLRLLAQRAVFGPLLLFCVGQSIPWGVFFLNTWEWRHARQAEGRIIQSSESRTESNKKARVQTWCNMTIEFPWKDPPRVGQLSIGGGCGEEERVGRTYTAYVNRQEGQMELSQQRHGNRMDRGVLLFLTVWLGAFCFMVGARVLRGPTH
jgi:Zn-finger nucleic acid-binding protein